MSNAFNHYSAALRVCVDQVEDGRISGRVFSQRLITPITFADFGGMLLQVEAVLDAQNFPQAFQRTRSFAPRQTAAVPAADCLEDGMSPEVVQAAQGTVGTFQLYVITRRNTTWQGFVDWLDGSPKQEYNSVLELLKLADEHVFHLAQ